MSLLVADEISPRLFMGPVPPPGSDVARAGFRTLILAATLREYKLVYDLARYEPVESKFPGVRTVFLVGLTDDYERPLTQLEFKRVVAASEAVRRSVLRQEKALVTCMMGRNRSGLIAALAYRSLANVSGRKAMERVRERRQALAVIDNPQYQKVLVSLSAPGQRISP